MIPDIQQRWEALDPARSFIVEAPAGSGKTTLLVQRYLKLLSVVERPESVVAMTFTRKAAAELRERVMEAFAKASSPDPVDEHQRETAELARMVLDRDAQMGWNLLADTRRLQIQTIDSLCAMLTRSMPVVSHLGGAPQVIEDASEMHRLAARRTLAALAESGAESAALFRRVALHFDNDLGRVKRQVARMLGRRDQWRSAESEAEEQTARDFCAILHEAEKQLRDVFREKGAVDFTEITRAAIEALGSPEHPSDLLFWLDYRIEHLLVDEFQDTSLTQYELLDRLTGQWSEGDNRTLFVVGDPMQSIYRFREANVGLFLRCWRDQQLGSVRLHPLRLTANFRSTPEIVTWAQDTFRDIMIEDDPRRGAVKLRPAVATRPETSVEPVLIPLIEDKGETEAAEVVRIVKQCLPKGDVAILVRSRTHLLDILPALRAAELAYEAVDIDSLCEEQHVIDVLSLTRAVLHIGDRVAWLSCLRAPWCGLDLAGFSELAEQKPDRHILQLLREFPSQDARFQRTTDVLERAVSAVGRLPLRDIVERAWLSLGGPSAMQTPGQREDVYAFLNVISEFEQGGIVKDLSLMGERLKRLFAKPATGPECVKIMTIHSAKGLEFDTVIVPRLGAQAKIDEYELLEWTRTLDESGQPGLRLAAQPRRNESDADYEAVRVAKALETREELKRLLYVAVTRAKNRLFLLGCVGRKNDGSVKKPQDGTFLELLWPRVSGEFEGASRRYYTQPSLFEIAQARRASHVLRRLPADWHQPRLARSVDWQPQLTRAVASVRTIGYEWVKDTGRQVGTIVHEMLKRISREPVASWTEQRLLSVKPIVLSELQRVGIPASDQNAAATQAINVVRKMLSSDRGRWILGDHPDARSEWAIAGRIGDQLITGTIDRAFRDEQGRLWIIDYKTSSHEGSDLEEFLQKQHARYSSQLEVYAALVAKMMPGPVHVGLYFPMLDAWHEWQPAEAGDLAASYTGS